jgi:hypothetical protein
MCRILGTKHPVPLTPADMAKSLRVAFYPPVIHSQRLDNFLRRLRSGLIHSGVKVISYQEALAEGSDGRIGEGIVLIAPGEGEAGNLAIDHVTSLSNNTVVAVLDGTLPGTGDTRLQRRVDALIAALVWHMAHVLIYVDDLSWTICNMNGAINTFSLEMLEDRILHSLIPKLAAPVVPPEKSDFEIREGVFDASAPDYEVNVEDMMIGAELWGRTGLLASQTKIAELVFRNNRYRRIAGAYLNWRTGMSYGFLARQLPVLTQPALDLDEAAPILKRLDWTENDFLELDGYPYVALKLQSKRFLVRVPEISVLCTRSGCEKTSFDTAKDLVKLGLNKGRMILATPKGIGEGGDCEPSFDTASILAHAVGNAIVASILKKVKPCSKFCLALSRKGLALAHWHGYLHPSVLPRGYYLYGQANPPVSCSTPQAAIYALSGKFAALQRSLEEGAEYLGDVHEEPSHGTNMIGESLVDLAHLVAGTAM